MNTSALTLGRFLLISLLSLRFWYFCSGFLLLSAVGRSGLVGRSLVLSWQVLLMDAIYMSGILPRGVPALFKHWYPVHLASTFISLFILFWFTGKLLKASVFHPLLRNNWTVHSDRQTLYWWCQKFKIGGEISPRTTQVFARRRDSGENSPTLERVQSGPCKLLPLMNEKIAMIYPIMPALGNLWHQDMKRTFVSSSQILRKMDNSVLSMGQLLLISQLSRKRSFWIYFVLYFLLYWTLKSARKESHSLSAGGSILV